MDWTFRIESLFRDSRPPLDVRYDVEKRVRRLLPRQVLRPDALVFRAASQSFTTSGQTIIELRLEAAFETYNIYALQLDFEGPNDPRNENIYTDNMRRAFAGWTAGLEVTEAQGGSPDRYRQVMEEAIAQEVPHANQIHPEEDEAVRTLQKAILAGLSQGKSFFTANKEGGTHIRLVDGRFVFADYGESDSREDFTSEAEFLARLRKFYDWESRREWVPHNAPEIEAWRYIERQLRE